MKQLLIAVIAIFSLFPGNTQAQSIELDKKLGAENAKMVEAQWGFYNDLEKAAYIESVGNRLVAHLKKPLFEYEFHIVPDKSPNAFALPGGHIYITTGLLPILETEDELACIMGHEIIHSNNRHTVRQLKKSILPRLLELPGELLGVINKDLGALFNAPIQTSNSLLFASYSRSSETEADIEGTALAAAAGYDPSAMITSLNRLSKTIEVAIGQSETKSYFNDHPYTPDRVSTIEKNVAKLSWQHGKNISDNFLYEFDSLLFGDSPSLGVIQGNKFLHPDLNFSITFPENWDIDNQATNVGAYNQDRNAAAFITIDNTDKSPAEAGKLFLSQMEEQYKSKLYAQEEYIINENKGFLVSFKDETGEVAMYGYILWVPLEGKLFKLIGIGPLEYKSLFEASAKSLHSLTNKERNSFKINLVRVVKAKKNETLESFSKRTGNKLNPDLTGVLNDRSLSDKLDKGEELKIVLSYPFKIDK